LGEELSFYAAHLSLHPQGVYDDQALAAAAESLEIARSGDRWNVMGYWTIGFIQDFRGNHELAAQSFVLALEAFSEVGDLIGKVFSLFYLVRHHRRSGQFDHARSYCRILFETADSSAEDEFKKVFVYSAGMLLVSRLNANVSELDTEDGLRAVMLLALTSNFLDERRYTWYRRHQPMDRSEVDLLRDRLGEAAFTRAWKEGEVLKLEQAVAIAQEVLDE
jgi:hypothetical protein